MKWYDAFDIWYIGCFLIVAGLAMVWKGEALNSCRRFFCLELRDVRLKERFVPVLARRVELEGDNTAAWRMTGFSSMVFGALVLLRAIAPVVGYALLCASFAIVTSQIYVNMRNRSPKRAASLQPRTVTSSVPIVWYAGGVVSALLPLGMWIYPPSRGAALLVCVACSVIVAVALRTAEMAALLAGEDPDVEVYVDNRLRWSRVAGLLVLGYAASYVFIAMTVPSLRHSPSIVIAIYAASSMLLFAFGIWAVAAFLRGRMRASSTPV